MAAPAEILKPYAEQELTQETRKSFDPLASVRMYRYDLENFGYVLPETRERVRDEELSLLVEGVDRAARTEFVLKRQGNDLTYFKNGEWRSYTAMLLTGEEVARAEVRADPRKQFLADHAVDDLTHGYKMRSLRPGEQHVWASPYEYGIEARYGKQFMRHHGRFPDRQMGFLYRAHCNDDGDVILESQTVDRSDNQAFVAALEAAKQNAATMDTMVHAYDAVLMRKQGGYFYAGRRGAEINENAWGIMLAQQDLIEYFLAELEMVARRPIYGKQLEEAAKRHVYGVWAAFKRRIDGETVIPVAHARPGMPIVHYAMLEREVQMAFDQFASKGFVMVGCGGAIMAIQGEQGIMNAEADDVFAAIFGKESGGEEDKYGPLEFKCKNGHTNRRPRNKLLKECRVPGCKNSVAC